MIEKLESYIDGSTLYVSTNFLAAYFKTNPRNVSHWIKKGLESHKLQNIKSNLFKLEETITWVEKNINKTKSENRKGTESGEQDKEKLLEDYENLTTPQKRALLKILDKNTLDELNTTEQILERESKNKANDKNWVRKEKPAQTIKALARSFISLMKNMMITISKEGEQRTQDELYHLMDKYLHTEIKKFQKMIQDESATLDLYEVYQIIIDAHDSGKTIEEIIKKIEELV